MSGNTESAHSSNSEASDMTYLYHAAGDIHDIHLLHATQNTMADFFQLIARLYYAAPVSGTTRILIRQTGPAIPLSYFMHEMRAFINQHGKMSRSAPARFAIILELTPFLQIIKQILKMMRHQDAVRFFNLHEHETAVTWLKR